MGRRRKKRSQKVGLPPGTLVHIGEAAARRIKVTLLDYNEQRVVEREILDLDDLQPFRDSDSVTWINVDGVQDVALVDRIGRMYGLHPLLQEDICNTDQRPKLDDYGDALYLDLKMLAFDEKTGEVVPEQVSVVVGRRWLLSFQEDEREGDVFNPVRDRISGGKGRIRSAGPDYLAYCLIDAIVDNYFLILERLGEALEKLEEEMIARPNADALQRVYRMKREMILLRRSVWPLREVIARLERAESPLIRPETAMFFRDVYDHAVHVIDEVETYREMLGGLIELYLSSVSNRMNEVMKFLTAISTIFIPLTFVAGVYGMNFEHMPELKWRFGYVLTLAGMAGMGLGLFLFFRRRGWI